MSDDGITGDNAEDTHVNAIHLLRTMQQHHVSLSLMADQKANILIGVNSVIFALVMRESASMTLPMLVLAATSATAAILCMLAVVPAIGWPKRRTGPPPPRNLLFFGAFSQLSEAQFQQELQGVMKSDAAIREAMVRDVYQLGIVLRTSKYRYIGWAYRVFVIGMILTLIGYGTERLLN